MIFYQRSTAPSCVENILLHSANQWQDSTRCGASDNYHFTQHIRTPVHNEIKKGSTVSITSDSNMLQLLHQLATMTDLPCSSEQHVLVSTSWPSPRTTVCCIWTLMTAFNKCKRLFISVHGGDTQSITVSQLKCSLLQFYDCKTLYFCGVSDWYLNKLFWGFSKSSTL